MGKIHRLLKKISEAKEKDANNIGQDGRDMKITDMKEKILEKIKEKKAAAGGDSPIDFPALSSRIGINATGAFKDAEEPQAQRIPACEVPPPPSVSEDADEETGPEGSPEGDHEKPVCAEPEVEKLKKLQEDIVGERDGLIAQLEEKNRAMAELEQKFKAETEELKAGRVVVKKKFLRFRTIPDYAALGRASEGRQRKFTDMETENKNLEDALSSAVKERDDLLAGIREKDQTISDLEKRLEEETECLKKERDKTSSNVEMLRAKLYSSEKEAKAWNDRISQLEEALKAKDKKVIDSERLLKNSETARNELIVKLKTQEEEKRALEENISRLDAELDAEERKLAENERAYARNIEMAKNEILLKLQAAERGKKELAGKISQLNLEIGAKDKRLADSEKSYAELDEMVNDAMMKLKTAEVEKDDLGMKISQLNLALDSVAKRREDDRILAQKKIDTIKAELDTMADAIREKEKAAADSNEMIAYLNSEIEARDEKIGSDARYCEKIAREINELKQKAKASNVRTNTAG